ncbi:MAG: hypothetical protein HRT61_00210 [Ekhidna sp.]|nr:hypothetical protein [Ekhidna sp.]
MAKDEEILVSQGEQREEKDLHNFAIKGIAEDMGLITKSHDQTEHNPHSEKSKEKKRLRDEFVQATMQAIIDAQNRLMRRLDEELKTIQEGLQLLETKMEENRTTWEKNGQTLNDISDLFDDFEDGGGLNREQAFSILTSTGLPSEALNELSDAQIITLIEEVRTQTLENNETLDAQFIALEQDHVRFKERENQIMDAKTRLEEISNDPSLDNDQKLSAINNLSKEAGTKTLHTLSNQTQEEEIKQTIDTAFIDNEVNTNISVAIKPAF